MVHFTTSPQLVCLVRRDSQATPRNGTWISQLSIYDMITVVLHYYGAMAVATPPFAYRFRGSTLPSLEVASGTASPPGLSWHPAWY